MDMFSVQEENYGVQMANDGFIKTFKRMGLGLLLTAIVAYLSYSTELYMHFLYGSSYAILAIVEVGVVLAFSFLYRKLSPEMVSFLFYLYAAINGITMGCIFAIYSMNTIFNAFLTAALLFGALAMYGANTQKDLTNLGSIFTVALFVGLIVSIINLFLGSTMLTIILDWGMLILFCGITAYDMNKLKYLQSEIGCEEEKAYVYCAMQLYLDFINIFLRVLSILGRNQRK